VYVIKFTCRCNAVCVFFWFVLYLWCVSEPGLKQKQIWNSPETCLKQIWNGERSALTETYQRTSFTISDLFQTCFRTVPNLFRFQICFCFRYVSELLLFPFSFISIVRARLHPPDNRTFRQHECYIAHNYLQTREAKFTLTNRHHTLNNTLFNRSPVWCNTSTTQGGHRLGRGRPAPHYRQ
jgi:hypothetical protein